MPRDKRPFLGVSAHTGVVVALSAGRKLRLSLDAELRKAGAAQGALASGVRQSGFACDRGVPVGRQTSHDFLRGKAPPRQRSDRPSDDLRPTDTPPKALSIFDCTNDDV
jgi:hypothetical protein